MRLFQFPHNFGLFCQQRLLFKEKIGCGKESQSQFPGENQVESVKGSMPQEIENTINNTSAIIGGILSKVPDQETKMQVKFTLPYYQRIESLGDILRNNELSGALFVLRNVAEKFEYAISSEDIRLITQNFKDFETNNDVINPGMLILMGNFHEHRSGTFEYVSRKAPMLSANHFFEKIDEIINAYEEIDTMRPIHDGDELLLYQSTIIDMFTFQLNRLSSPPTAEQFQKIQTLQNYMRDKYAHESNYYLSKKYEQFLSPETMFHILSKDEIMESYHNHIDYNFFWANDIIEDPLLQKTHDTLVANITGEGGYYVKPKIKDSSCTNFISQHNESAQQINGQNVYEYINNPAISDQEKILQLQIFMKPYYTERDSDKVFVFDIDKIDIVVCDKSLLALLVRYNAEIFRKHLYYDEFTGLYAEVKEEEDAFFGGKQYTTDVQRRIFKNALKIPFLKRVQREIPCPFENPSLLLQQAYANALTHIDMQKDKDSLSEENLKILILAHIDKEAMQYLLAIPDDNLRAEMLDLYVNLVDSAYKSAEQVHDMYTSSVYEYDEEQKRRHRGTKGKDDIMRSILANGRNLLGDCEKLFRTHDFRKTQSQQMSSQVDMIKQKWRDENERVRNIQLLIQSIPRSDVRNIDLDALFGVEVKMIENVEAFWNDSNNDHIKDVLIKTIQEQFPEGDDEVFLQDFVKDPTAKLYVALSEGEVIASLGTNELEKNKYYMDWVCVPQNPKIKGLGEAMFMYFDHIMQRDAVLKKQKEVYASSKPWVKSFRILVDRLGFVGYGTTDPEDPTYSGHVYEKVKRVKKWQKNTFVSKNLTADQQRYCVNTCRDAQYDELVPYVIDDTELLLCKVSFKGLTAANAAQPQCYDTIRKLHAEGYVQTRAIECDGKQEYIYIYEKKPQMLDNLRPKNIAKKIKKYQNRPQAVAKKEEKISYKHIKYLEKMCKKHLEIGDIQLSSDFFKKKKVQPEQLMNAFYEYKPTIIYKGEPTGCQLYFSVSVNRVSAHIYADTRSEFFNQEALDALVARMPFEFQVTEKWPSGDMFYKYRVDL